MKRLLIWVSDYWWIPALILVGAGISIFGRRAAQRVFGRSFPEHFDLEMDAVSARREARAIQLKQGRDEALHHIKTKYAIQLAVLDEYERNRARELEADPEKLAELLARYGR